MGKKMTFEEFEEFSQAARAEGGFWIRDDGKPVPVLRFCEHDETLGKIIGKAFPGYSEGYRRGMVRISFCGSHEFTADVPMDTVNDETMSSLLSLLRHFSKKLGERDHEFRKSVYINLKMPHQEKPQYGYSEVTRIGEEVGPDEDPSAPYLRAASKLSAWWLAERRKRKAALEAAKEEQVEAYAEALELAA